MTPQAVNADLLEITLEINTSYLFPATYDVILVGYRELDNFSYDLDCVSLPRYKKELTENRFLQNWSKTKWGFVKLPDIQTM